MSRTVMTGSIPRETSETSQTSPRVSDSDFSTWLTKQQAADAIGVTTKSVERFVQAGQIQQARWQREGRGPLLAVYQPEDVARIASERRGGPLPAFLVPGSGPAANENAHPPVNALTISPSASPFGNFEEARRAFVAGLSDFAGLLKTVSQTSETHVGNPFLTLAEAAAAKRVSERLLLRWIRTGKLAHEREPRSQWTAADRGWRVRRRDLEQL